MAQSNRQSTGIAGLDEMLGGGLLPGTLTVVVGSTGIGKTQLGLQFAAAGQADEGRRGVIFDVAARGDSQNHAQYAQRMFNWTLEAIPSQHPTAAREYSTAGFIGDSTQPAPGDAARTAGRKG